jgi:hypothetical protein
VQVQNRMTVFTTTSARRRVIGAVFLTLTWCTPAFSQAPAPPLVTAASLSGPRLGFTFLSDGIVERLKDDVSITISPVVTQFGWQFEKQFYSTDNGPTAVTEWVVLVGGLEQGVVLPSVSWLVGMRTMKGAEFGIGPNLTPVGAALAIAAGMTFRAGALNVPVNVAVVPSKSGVRVSLLAGFNTRR